MIIDEHIKKALKEGDKLMSEAFRAVKSKILLEKTSKNYKDTPDEQLFLKAVQKEIKEREESNSFIQDPENETKIRNAAVVEKLSKFLPKMLSEAEQIEAIERAIESSGAKEPKEMGKAMEALAPIRDQLDMKFVSGKIREILSGGSA